MSDREVESPETACRVTPELHDVSSVGKIGGGRRWTGEPGGGRAAIGCSSERGVGKETEADLELAKAADEGRRRAKEAARRGRLRTRKAADEESGGRVKRWDKGGGEYV